MSPYANSRRPMTRHSLWLAGWRREELRTTLWVVPTLLSLGVVVLFVITLLIDEAAYHGHLQLPAWMDQGSADAGRQVLSAAAAGVITVAGVVFSVTIVVLTLASQQFGPRMLRNFIRDLGTQVSLGAYVATFVFSVLALASINGNFVPHLTISVCLLMLLIDVVVLIYFIHHITVTIQLPQVMAGISADLHVAIDASFPITAEGSGRSDEAEVAAVSRRLWKDGVVIPSDRSGYLQFVRHEVLVDIAEANDSVIELAYRTGHFVTAGLPLARVWPPKAAPAVAAALRQAHVAGPYRTLTQDPVFAIDQLAEIAIRALSPAVNDTFTALTCIDWLADGLCVVTSRDLPDGVHRDTTGAIRVIELAPSYSRVVNRACDKIRQSGRGMPAVLIRQIDALGKVLTIAHTPEQYRVLLRQVDMVAAAGRDDIPDPNDRNDLHQRHQALLERFAHPDDVTLGG